MGGRFQRSHFFKYGWGRNQIEYVIDINTRKHGKFIPGTGQKIVPPEFLREYRPDVAIVMNPIYKNEIQQTLDQLGLSTQLMLVL